MSHGTIGTIIACLKAWALGHHPNIIEVTIVGSQAQVPESESPCAKSDLDLFVLVKPDVDPRILFSELAAIGLEYSILLHPLIMTKDEWNQKVRIDHYRKMRDSERRIYPLD